MITHSVANAQGRRLVQAVRRVSEKLGRPVSGRDLELYFRQHPHERPELMQAPGQLLLKASRPFDGVDRVYQVGLLGNRGYYAADTDPTWASKLARYEADVWLERAIREDLPGKVRILLRGSLGGLARNALAGWCREMAQILPLADDKTRVTTGTVMTKAAEKEAAPFFARRAPDDLITRAEAIAILSRELGRRADYLQGVAINWNRVTTEWTWPQSRLFRTEEPGPVHSHAQIELLASVLWPDACEVTDRLVADLWARRYGVL
jgi:hypothetical protein